MKIELTGIEPVSLNHYQKIRVVKQRGRYMPIKYKPPASVQFDVDVDNQLMMMRKEFKKFNDLYDSSIHYLIANYRFYYPIFTKKGHISRKSKDVDNLVKPINDLLFSYLKADDAEIIELVAMKFHSETPKIIIELSFNELHLIK